MLVLLLGASPFSSKWSWFSGRLYWFPSVTVSKQCSNWVSMETACPLKDKAPDVASSHFCHILLDKANHKANSESKV